MTARNKSYSRSGSIALYSFTPFKVLESSEVVYRLILVPLAGFVVEKYVGSNLKSKRICWRTKATIVRDKVSINVGEHVIIKNIVLPTEIYSKVFEQTSKVKYVYKMIGNGPAPRYIEYSYEALTRPKVCRHGYVLLSSEEECPLRNVCRKYSVRERGGCKYYCGVDNTYVGLFNVFPEVRTVFEVDPADIKDILAYPLPHGFEQLFRLGFTEKGSGYVFINSVFLAPKQRIFFRPYFILYPLEGLGYRIENVHALIFDFEKNSLYKLLEKLYLIEDVRNWLVYKFRLLSNVLREDFSDLVNPRKDYGFRVFREMVREIEGVANRGSFGIDAIRENERDLFMKYYSYVFLHTFAHIVISFIASYMQCDESILHYFIEHPFTGHRDKYRVIVFEDASGGYGFLQEFSLMLKESSRDAFSDFIKYVSNIFPKPLRSKRYSRYCAVSKLDLKNIPQSLVSSIKYDILNRVNDSSSREAVESMASIIYDVLSKYTIMGVYPHVLAMRRYVLGRLGRVSERVRAWIDDIFALYPSCWDCCPLCVMFEKGCIYHSYNQPFTLSSTLMKHFIEMLNSVHLAGLSVGERCRKVGDIVNKIISYTKFSLKIASPYLSVGPLRNIVVPLLKRKVNVDIVTLPEDEAGNEAHNKALAFLRNLRGTYFNLSVYLVSYALHDKFIIIDDLILIDGSFNFTDHGLYRNLESIRVSYRRLDIDDASRKFEHLKAGSKSL